MKFWYNVRKGTLGKTGYCVPVSRQRAKRLMRYATGIERGSCGIRHISLSVAPKEVARAAGSSEYSLAIGR